MQHTISSKTLSFFCNAAGLELSAARRGETVALDGVGKYRPDCYIISGPDGKQMFGTLSGAAEYAIDYIKGDKK